ITPYPGDLGPYARPSESLPGHRRVDVVGGSRVGGGRDSAGYHEGEAGVERLAAGYVLRRRDRIALGKIANEGDALLGLASLVDALDDDAGVVVARCEVAGSDVRDPRLHVVGRRGLLRCVELDPVEVGERSLCDRS